jgi:methionine-rich copper-binding protein CopC
MRRTVVLLAAMAAMVVVYAGVALAAPVDEVDPNNTFAEAQNIDDYFSLDADPNISNDYTGTENTSTTVAHATVNGTGDGTVDYYSFTVPEGGGIGSIDIDGAYPGFDSVLRLYNSNGDLLAANDDNVYGDPGSQSYRDSYLQHPFPGAAGSYYIKVSSYFENGIDTSYKVHVSIPNHPLQVVADNTAPTVTSTTPADNGTMTNRASNVTATFSEDVQNVDATTFKLEQVKVSRKGVETTSPVAATVTPASGTAAQGASATLNPSKDLQRGSTYRATLTSGVTDTAGNALGAPYSWTFKVSR